MGREDRRATCLPASVTALARKLAVIMHRMWLDGTEFRFAAGTPTDGARPSRKRAVLSAA